MNRFFFPERNIIMSAFSEATIIVEAGETSGTRIQARAALQQGKKLFIMDNIFQQDLSWPKVFEKQGAIRLKSLSQLEDYFK
jgi:DNA processing protein